MRAEIPMKRIGSLQNSIGLSTSPVCPIAMSHTSRLTDAIPTTDYRMPSAKRSSRNSRVEREIRPALLVDIASSDV